MRNFPRNLFIFITISINLAIASNDRHLHDLFLDLSEVSQHEINQNAKSVAAMINTNKILHQTNNISRIQYQKFNNIEFCPEIPMRDDKSFSKCSGFLASKNKIITSGHCVDTIGACDNYAWVFNLSSTNKNHEYIKNDEIYRCKKIHRKNRVNIFGPELGKTDIAVIELDRPVKGISPLKLNTKFTNIENKLVYSLSYPLGTYLKFHGGSITGKFNNNNFYTDQTVLPGSSGAPVIDIQTNTVVGIINKSVKYLKYNNERKCTEFIYPSAQNLYKNELYSSAISIDKAASLLRK